ncbi:MAG: hypothetical protein WCO52_01475 [bacterium]
MGARITFAVVFAVVYMYMLSICIEEGFKYKPLNGRLREVVIAVMAGIISVHLLVLMSELLVVAIRPRAYVGAAVSWVVVYLLSVFGSVLWRKAQ